MLVQHHRPVGKAMYLFQAHVPAVEACQEDAPALGAQIDRRHIARRHGPLLPFYVLIPTGRCANSYVPDKSALNFRMRFYPACPVGAESPRICRCDSSIDVENIAGALE